MRVIWIYLAVYFALLVGAGAVLWEAGLFAEFPPPWVALAVLVAVGLGLLLAAVSLPPRTPLGPGDRRRAPGIGMRERGVRGRA